LAFPIQVAMTVIREVSMSEIILVRHGQANSKATSEAEYDRLSDLGWQQARWLGDHLRATNSHFDRVVAGDMRRHLETAEGAGVVPQVDARWNELSYFGLSAALQAETGLPHPEQGAGFVDHAHILFDRWTGGGLPDGPETWAGFEGRVLGALGDLAQAGGSTLVVTSAGVIAAVMRHVMGLQTAAQVRLLAQIANTSIHRLEYLRQDFYVAEFNATPHVDAPDRRTSRTFY
jgi:broad specificity phosphatase PhoE